MTGIGQLGVTIGAICIAVSILSVLIPQKRTRRILSFVIGLFFIGSILSAAASMIPQFSAEKPMFNEPTVPQYDEDDYCGAILRLTAEKAAQALDELLSNEGIHAESIKVTLKKSAEESISVSEVIIYISEEDVDRVDEIESIVYRNVSKEPEIYAKGNKVR